MLSIKAFLLAQIIINPSKERFLVVFFFSDHLLRWLNANEFILWISTRQIYSPQSFQLVQCSGKKTKHLNICYLFLIPLSHRWAQIIPLNCAEYDWMYIHTKKFRIYFETRKNASNKKKRGREQFTDYLVFGVIHLYGMFSRSTKCLSNYLYHYANASF